MLKIDESRGIDRIAGAISRTIVRSYPADAAESLNPYYCSLAPVHI